MIFRKVVPFLLLIFFLFGLYWLKSNLRIEFSDTYSLSDYFPFKYLVPGKVVTSREPGWIFRDSFDGYSFFDDWSPLWMSEKGGVKKGYDDNEIDQSRCLLIISSSKASWSYSHDDTVKVWPGDVFKYRYAVKLVGDDLWAQAGVATFRKDRSVISWNYAAKITGAVDDWMVIENTFTIPQDISFIRFRFSGTGKGESRFDNVILERITNR